MLLVLDCCFNACSVALLNRGSGIVASRYDEMERGHAEAIGPMVEAVMAEAGVSPADLTGISVTRGPGTFTGQRIGLAYAKGMALALSIPLQGIDSLTATAAPCLASGQSILVVHKAGASGFFYWAIVEAQTPAMPTLGRIADIVAAVPKTVGHVVGSGADLVCAQRPDMIALQPSWPDAKHFAAIAAKLPFTTEPIEPLYLREPDAKQSVSATLSRSNVRPATGADLGLLATIHAACFAEGWTADTLQAAVALPGAGILIVELAGVIYGFVQYQWVAGEAEIHTICVLPNYRRQHFGQDLMQELRRVLSALGTQKLFLEVSAQNTGAQRFYEKSGFRQAGLRKSYYADGSDAIVMALDLPS